MLNVNESLNKLFSFRDFNKLYKDNMDNMDDPYMDEETRKRPLSVDDANDGRRMKRSNNNSGSK